MDERSGEQVGSALRRLAQELAAERRFVVSLERENRRLRAQIKVAEEAPREPDGDSRTRSMWNNLVEPAERVAVRRGCVTTGT